MSDADLRITTLDSGLTVATERVPGTLSVVGSDGLALAAMTSPPLTTVAAPLDQLGRTARQRLAEVLAHRPGPSVTTLRPELIVRSSTAAPSARVRDLADPHRKHEPPAEGPT